MKTRVPVTCAAVACFTAGSALALQTSMNVRADVVSACSEVAVADLDFGTAGQSDATQDTTTTVSVTCTDGTSYDVEMDYGVNAGGGTQRRLADEAGTDFLDYDLFQPDASGAAATDTPWGAKADGGEYAGIGTGSSQSLVATGRLHRRAQSTAGLFTDAVVVRLNF
jgi:spore coat protein U-like protein